VWLVFLLYVFLAAIITFGPVLVSLLLSAEETNRAGVYLLVAVAYFLIVLGGGASLLIIPIRAWPDPDRRQSIWFPLIGSVLLAAVVSAGFRLAASELADIPQMLYAVLGTIPLVWLLWAGLFWYLSRSVDPLTLNGRMYKTLLAGSVLEFVVAVPMHLIVRQRDHCCGGFMTGAGIAFGLLVAFIALGPAVFFLFFRRHKQAYRRK